ncbi:hypothetical protein [Streptomyces nojiriensis]|uniref:Uncharacterized protein n=1 Tax=Streptomyces nojiriensis TaxID=66374 RepID=A0ABQ3SKF5_9ACTN|nr:hypothetical protein [Streptomyces nojiriensis]GGS21468.1 hypothetical protein GCM10010205_59360 [Streptomyces nojiriensis]GHI68340.1 hypothetical protein Snoj_22580 [Streptomyces nojiriensis]
MLGTATPAAKRRGSAAVVATCLVLTGFSGVAQAAESGRTGVKGEQIIACDDTGLWTAVKLRGKNAKGQDQTAPLANLDEAGCVSFNGLWWKGKVTLTWLRDGGKRGESTCYTTADPDGGNWQTCIYEPRRSVRDSG